MNMASYSKLLFPSLVQSLKRSELILHKLLGRYHTLCIFLACEKTLVSQLRPQVLSSPSSEQERWRKRDWFGSDYVRFQMINQTPNPLGIFNGMKPTLFLRLLISESNVSKRLANDTRIFFFALHCSTLHYLNACNRLKHHDLHHKQVA